MPTAGRWFGSAERPASAAEDAGSSCLSRETPPARVDGPAASLLPRALALLLLLVPMVSCQRPAPPDRTLVIGQFSSAVSLDPHLHDELSTYATLDHFYEKLVTFDGDMRVVPELALHWENPSENVWRFHLRHGVTFHDGRPFGSPDVVTSLRRALQLPGSKVSHYLEAVEHIRALGEHTVEIVTRHPRPVLLNKLVFIGLVPRDTPSAPIEHPVGTGPYRYVSGVPGGPIKGERFDRFWGDRPAFGRVVVVQLENDRDMAEAVPKGKADVVGWFPREHWAWGRTQKGVRMVSRPGLSVVMLGFSLRAGSPFEDLRLREAVGLAVDREKLAARTAGSAGATGSTLQQAAGAALAIPMDQIVPKGVFGHSSELPRLPHDPSRAAAFLREAGFSAGLDAELLLPESLVDTGKELSEQLASVGVRLHLAPQPWPTFLEKWEKEAPSLVLFAWVAATGDISDAWSELLRPPAEDGGNRFSYQNSELTRLIELSGRRLDPRERRELLFKAVTIVRDDLPVLPLITGSNLYAIRSDLEWMPRSDRRLRAFDVRPAAAP